MHSSHHLLFHNWDPPKFLPLSFCIHHYSYSYPFIRSLNVFELPQTWHITTSISVNSFITPRPNLHRLIQDSNPGVHLKHIPSRTFNRLTPEIPPLLSPDEQLLFLQSSFRFYKLKVLHRLTPSSATNTLRHKVPSQHTPGTTPPPRCKRNDMKVIVLVTTRLYCSCWFLCPTHWQYSQSARIVF